MVHLVPFHLLKRSVVIILFIAALLYVPTTVWGQKVQPEVQSAAGGHFANSTLRMSWTIGEIAVETLSNGNLRLTQGFHQPVIIKTVSVEEEYKSSFSVYPNPAVDYVMINTGSYKGFRVEMRNLIGELIYEGRSEDNILRIDFGVLANGTYMLTLYSETGRPVATYQIQKVK